MFGVLREKEMMRLEGIVSEQILIVDSNTTKGMRMRWMIERTEQGDKEDSEEHANAHALSI